MMNNTLYRLLAMLLLVSGTAHAAPKQAESKAAAKTASKDKAKDTKKVEPKKAETKKSASKDNAKTKEQAKSKNTTKPVEKKTSKPVEKPKPTPKPEPKKVVPKPVQKAAPRNDILGQMITRQAQRQAATPKPAPAPAPQPKVVAPPLEPAPRREEPVASNSSGDTDELIRSAMGFLGVAYRFGGASPTGFDCSGFMQYVFRKSFGVNLPRTSAAQAGIGSHVSRSELQAGDMVFFRTHGSRISHVGMYVGGGRFIHAPRTGKRIEITSLSNKYWNSRYATARRVKRNNAQNFIRN